MSKLFDTRRERRKGNTFFRDDVLGPAFGSSLWEDCPVQAIQQDPSVGWFYKNDFHTFTTGEAGLAATLTNSGTVAVQTATAGNRHYILMSPADGSVADNDEAYVGSEATTYILEAGKDIWFEARVKITEAATNIANVGVGLSTLYNADSLQDAGAGPPADYDGILLFKVDGGTVWQAENSVATSQTTTASLVTRTTTWTKVGFRVHGTSDIDYYVDGAKLATHSTNLPTAAMGLYLGVKNGAVTTHDKLSVDYVMIAGLR